MADVVVVLVFGEEVEVEGFVKGCEFLRCAGTGHLDSSSAARN